MSTILNKRYYRDYECDDTIPIKKSYHNNIMNIKKSYHENIMNIKKLSINANNIIEKEKEKEEILVSSKLNSNYDNESLSSKSNSSTPILHRRTRNECDFSCSPVSEMCISSGIDSLSFVTNSNIHIPGIKKLKPSNNNINNESIDNNNKSNIIIEEVSESEDDEIEKKVNDKKLENSFNMDLSLSDKPCSVLALLQQYPITIDKNLLNLSTFDKEASENYFKRQQERKVLKDIKESSIIFGKLAHNLALEKFKADATNKLAQLNNPEFSESMLE